VYREYWPGTDNAKFSSYHDASWAITSWNEHYESGRLYKKGASDGTQYEYSDEDWNGKDYGKLIKETAPDNSYKIYTDYYPGTEQARFVSEYDADGTLLVTNEYDENGDLIGSVAASEQLQPLSEFAEILQKNAVIDEQSSYNAGYVPTLSNEDLTLDNA